MGGTRTGKTHMQTIAFLLASIYLEKNEFIWFLKLADALPVSFGQKCLQRIFDNNKALLFLLLILLNKIARCNYPCILKYHKNDFV